MKEEENIGKKRRMSKVESDRFYERMLKARYEAQEVTAQKRKMMMQIKEYEEMRELRPNPRGGTLNLELNK